MSLFILPHYQLKLRLVVNFKARNKVTSGKRGKERRGEAIRPGALRVSSAEPCGLSCIHRGNGDTEPSGTNAPRSHWVYSSDHYRA
ncbi:hypothetical protein PoB_006068800 [Plakobranchus ocellatus]|uniref:Uncharacterized protein n=1 Tax=Plakobranchus ocellatus TaxID=259542 RepID=A0AAV4CQL5_9GAST|nr:hypothetical protein PoB_006068800 [Plakobranchus ocellatus]